MKRHLLMIAMLAISSLPLSATDGTFSVQPSVSSPVSWSWEDSGPILSRMPDFTTVLEDSAQFLSRDSVFPGIWEDSDSFYSRDSLRVRRTYVSDGSEDDWLDCVVVLTGAESAESLDEDVLDRFERFRNHPLAINESSHKALSTSGLLSLYQIATLTDYISTSGDVLSITELSMIDGFGETYARALAPFITLSSSRLPGAVDTTSRSYSTLMLRTSFKDDDWSYGLKYRIQGSYGRNFSSKESSGRLFRKGKEGREGREGRESNGQSFRNDKEESSRQLFRHDSRESSGRIFRTYEAGIAAKSPWGNFFHEPSSWGGFLSLSTSHLTMIFGDFNTRFGQGVALWNGFTLSGVQAPSSFYRRPTGLSPALSFSSASSAHRGLALEYSRLRLSASTFISFPDLRSYMDAYDFSFLKSSGGPASLASSIPSYVTYDTSPSTIPSIASTSTSSSNVSSNPFPLLAGANLTWLGKYGQIGMTGYVRISDLSFKRAGTVSKSGTSGSTVPDFLSDAKISLDARFCLGGNELFDEVVYDPILKVAAGVAGAMIPIGENWAASVMGRYYPSAYKASFAGAVRGASKVSDEIGAAMGLKWKDAYLSVDFLEKPSTKPSTNLSTKLSTNLSTNPPTNPSTESSMKPSSSLYTETSVPPFSASDLLTKSAFPNEEYFLSTTTESPAMTYANSQLKAILYIPVKIGSHWTVKSKITTRLRNYDLLRKHGARIDVVRTDGLWQTTLRGEVSAATGFGFLGYLETGMKSDKGFFWIRGCAFRVDNWDDRIYVYERSAPGNFSVPACYGRGILASAYLGKTFDIGRNGIARKASESSDKSSPSDSVHHPRSGHNLILKTYFKTSLTAYPFMPLDTRKPSLFQASLQLNLKF